MATTVSTCNALPEYGWGYYKNNFMLKTIMPSFWKSIKKYVFEYKEITAASQVKAGVAWYQSGYITSAYATSPAATKTQLKNGNMTITIAHNRYTGSGKTVGLYLLAFWGANAMEFIPVSLYYYL